MIWIFADGPLEVSTSLDGISRIEQQGPQSRQQGTRVGMGR